MSTENAIVPAGDNVQLSAAAAAVIPLAHHDKFYGLPTKEQQRVSLLLRLFDEIGSAPEGVVATCQRLALEHTGRGFSAGSLKNNYYAFVNAKRDWRVVARRYAKRETRPDAFEQEVRRRIEANSRGARQAIMSIYRDWQNGVSIPGYGTWQEYYLAEFPDRDVPDRYPMGFYPEGWSQSSLYTLQTSKAERALARRGFAAAKRYLPHVVRDRSGLRPLELIVIDDFKTDQIVRAWNPERQRWEMVPCNGLLAIDAATGRKLALGLKPEFSRAKKIENGESDGVTKEPASKRHAITRADVQGLLYSVFCDHGLPSDYGCTILCENAAAAISPDFELALETLLGVQVARTGLLADKTLRNGFIERGGKPWEKGWIESTFNLLHNMAGALPGQKGATYQLKPGDLEAKLLFAEKLLSIEGLTHEQTAQLRVNFWTDGELLTAYEKIFAVMERRTDHRMQGFAEIFDYALPDGSGVVTEQALSVASLTRDELLACTPVPRRESPLERWERLNRDAARVAVPEAALMLLLLTPKTVTLAKHRVTFEHCSQGYTFSDADSDVLALPEGTELLGYFDPARPHVLHCTHTDGRYVGKLRRRGAVDLRDRAAINAEHVEIMRVITKHVIEPVRERHAASDAQQLADDQHNLAKLREWNVPAKAIPSRLLPPAEKPDRSSQSTDTTANAAEPVATLSAKLARTAPARDAFAVHREALARGIAQHETERDAQAAIDPAAILKERAKTAEKVSKATPPSWL